MFDFLSFLIAIVALIVAAKAFNQVAALRQRIYALERAAPRAQAAPPPLAPYLQADQTRPAASPDVQPPPVPEIEPAAPTAASPDMAPAHEAAGTAPTPPPLP